MNSIAEFVVPLFEPLAEDFADSHWRSKRDEGGSGEEEEEEEGSGEEERGRSSPSQGEVEMVARVEVTGNEVDNGDGSLVPREGRGRLVDCFEYLRCVTAHLHRE
jgi:hypothetical protein